MRRVRCPRICLYKSLRAVNLFVNFCGVGMIIYSLWLFKKWDAGLSELSASEKAALPRPWFILVCLAVGIIVCLITLCGHMVANCISKSILSIVSFFTPSSFYLIVYVVSICSLVLLQGEVIITIFFKMDMEEELEKYIDNTHEIFKSFIIFHLEMCRLISIMALAAQINIIVLSIVLWIVGTESMTQRDILDVPDFNSSFLVSPNSPVNDDDSNTRKNIKWLLGAPRLLEGYV